jgi:hypothetical protein
LIGAPVGYVVERIFNRPRLRIAYVHTGYEDIIMLSPSVQRNISRYNGYVDFMSGQVQWAFKQRLAGNMFTREELRLVFDPTVRFQESFKQIAADSAKKLAEAATGKIDTQFIVGFESDYYNQLGRDLAADWKNEPEKTAQRIGFWLTDKFTPRSETQGKWLDEFVQEVKTLLEKKTGSSKKIVIRVGLGNSGFQDGVVSAEAKLKVKDLEFRLPLHTAFRPWEADGDASPQSYLIIKSKNLQVLDFVVDENMNAYNNIEELRGQLSRGVDADVVIFGTEKENVAKRSFTASLPPFV